MFFRSWPIAREKVIFLTVRDEKGYALPLVLGISMVIVVITMAIVFSVRQKIGLAIELKDRNMAYVAAHSAYNQVLYNILTSMFTSYGLNMQQEDGKEGVWWNLYGDPIKLENGVTVRLRDTAGMASPLTRPRLFKKLVAHSSDDSNAANAFIDTLADWQDIDDLKKLNGAESYDYGMAGYDYGPRNFYIQVMEEIFLLKDFPPHLFDKIKDDCFFWGFANINYMAMSEKMLRIVFADESTVDRILKLRETKELTPPIFRSITGVPWIETVSFFPSGWIKVDIVAPVNKAVEKIHAVVVKRETDRAPFRVVEWKK